MQKLKVEDKCFYLIQHQNTLEIFKTKILALGEKPHCFDIRAARRNSDYSGLYPIMKNVHISNLFSEKELLTEIKKWSKEK